MAGIGFELRRLADSETYLGLLRAYTYAGVIGSGPWVLSILAILILGFMSLGIVIPPGLITQFQVSVTWLIALSLIYTGGLQLIFTRYVADRLFAQEPKRVIPNLIGMLFIALTPAFLLAVAASLWLLPGTSAAYRLLMILGGLLLCVIWVLTVLLSGLKQYGAVLTLYALGYGSAVASGLWLRPWGLEGLLAGFVLGQIVLAVGMFALIWREYPPTRFVEFDFFVPGRLHGWLFFAGLFFNLGVWIDKLMFWLWPGTGSTVIGTLHASVIYDTPVFLAYFTIIPGMAVFLLRMEVDFVYAYDRYYNAVRDGGALSAIRDHRARMVIAAREGLFGILKVQGMTLLFLIVFGGHALHLLGISPLFEPLLILDSLGVMLQLLVMAGLNILFYLDRTRDAALIALLMFASNALFTLISLLLGPYFYGYGFAAAMLLTALVALTLTDRTLERLDYETFMLR
ncbi:histidine kinase [Acidihalobacter yilgarnensis]|uniref:Histidine kinase n=1 Tax=Acidihalobacter yilgarnensis TaxID=2819280 RepID=A0A1D8IKY7_9GAMM|nr:exopolysaccharide Pel transporter PelG [Acidihalobacter yilgarnensis]AOU97136.1 histidine kinase [Acidihalobacter yilgarnensis]